MKNVIFILFFNLFFVTQSLYSFNFEFIELPIQKFNQQNTFLASQNQYYTYISDINIIVVSNDSIVFSFNFDEKIKIEPKCISNFTLYLYYTGLKKPKYEVYNQFELNKANYPTGIYFLSLTISGRTQTLKFAIVR